jgi:DNA invertase Pin-like site-specific DNA recombinase
VCVKDISRLARNTLDFLESIRTLKAMNIETLFITNNMTILGNSEFIPTIMAAVAQEESANTSKRIKFGKKQNAEKGRVPNYVYGYDKTKGDFFNLSVNSFEADVIRRIFHMYLEQGCGASKIAMELNKDGIKTKRGAIFTQNAIVRILTNEIYTGKIINRKEEVKDFLTGERRTNEINDWIITDKPELQIISEENFLRVKELLESRHVAFNHKKERHSNVYVFSTLIKCAHCGFSFRRNRYTYVNTFTKWVCSGRNGKGTGYCPNKTIIDENELMEEIKNYLANILKNRKNMTGNIVKEFRQNYKDKEGAEADAKTISAELSRLKTKRGRELDLYTDGIIDKTELKERTDFITKRINVLERDLQLAEQNLSKADVLADQIQNLFSTIEQALSEDVLTNAILKKIIAKIETTSDGEVNIYLRPIGEIGLNSAYQFNDNYT